MYLYLIIFLLIVTVISFLFIDEGIMAGLFTIITIVAFLFVLSAVDEIAKARGTIEAQTPIIKHYENYVQALNEQLSDIKQQGQFTLNADKPVAALIQAKQNGLVALLDAQKAVDEARLNLVQIKHGVFGWVMSNEDKQAIKQQLGESNE